MIASKLKEAVSFEKLNIEGLKPNNKEKFSSLLINDEFRKAKTFREQVNTHTHTVCAPYYKAAPYNISHTKIFQWRFSL